MSSSNPAPTRRLTADFFVTLDGYAKGDRSPAYFGMLGPELEHWIEREVEKPRTIVMGRVTYEALAKYDGGTGPLAKMPKVMLSRTRTEASWGETRIVGSDEALLALQQEPGPPLRIMGSVSLVQRLLRVVALDRLRLVVFPVLLGETGSEPIFENLPDLALELGGTEVLDGRLVVVEYRPAR